jgi:hypothetical protein
MNEDGLLWLGAALWLNRHGGALIVRHAPETVVPFALALCQAIERPAPAADRSGSR